jgi:NADH-quinone oxidoreductase subunit M
MGGYGFIRFSLPMFPDASHYFAPLVYALSIMAVVYTSMVALAQTDMKKLIAYSSIAHMGVVTIGLFTFNRQGVRDAPIFSRERAAEIACRTAKPTDRGSPRRWG